MYPELAGIPVFCKHLHGKGFPRKLFSARLEIFEFLFPCISVYIKFLQCCHCIARKLATITVNPRRRPRQEILTELRLRLRSRPWLMAITAVLPFSARSSSKCKTVDLHEQSEDLDTIANNSFADDLPLGLAWEKLLQGTELKTNNNSTTTSNLCRICL